MATKDDLLLRETLHATLTTKGTELTNPEGDANIILIWELFTSLMSGNGVTPYNPITAYSGTIYVTYGQNLWVHLGAGPDTGVTPGTNGAIWQLSSIGMLAHQQNTDTYLGFGTAVQVTAAALWSIINEQVITITIAQFVIKAGLGTLLPNRLYYVSDAGEYYFRTLSASTYSRQGYMRVSVPKYDTLSVYEFDGMYSIGDRKIWNGVVYNNTTGTNSGTAPNSDFTNWTAETLFDATYYDTVIYNAEMAITPGNVVEVYRILDQAGNVFHGAITMHGDVSYKFRNSSEEGSSIEAFNYRGTIRYNKLIKSTLTVGQDPNNTGVITGNVFINTIFNLGIDDLSSQNQGTLSSCVFENVTIEAQEGMASGAVLNNVQIRMRKGDTIYLDDDVSISGGYLTREGGDIEKILTSGSADIVMTSQMNLYGILRLKCSGNLNTVSGFNAMPQKIKIMAQAGDTIDIQTQDLASVAIEQFLYDGTVLNLDDNNNDYIEVIHETIPSLGFAVWRVLSVNIAS